MKLVRLTSVVSLLLVAGAATTAASYGSAPSYGTPESYGLAWGQQTSFGYGSSFRAIDVADGVVWAAGEANPTDSGDIDVHIQRLTESGDDLTQLSEGAADKPDTVSGIDAGPWGAVAAGTTLGVFPGSDATPGDGQHGWVQRLNPDGSVAWTTQFDGGRAAYISGVVVHGDTVVVAGNSYPTGQDADIEVDSFDLATGEALASRTFGTSADDFVGAVTVLDDEIVVGGDTYGTFGPKASPGNGDALVVAIDPTDLSTRWVTQLGTADVVATLTDRDGVIYWGGGSSSEGDPVEASGSVGVVGALASDGAPMWQDTVGAQGALVRSITTTSRGVVLGGILQPSDPSSYEAYLEGRAFDGTPQWHLALNPPAIPSHDMIMGVVAPADRVFFAGISSEGLFAPRTPGHWSDALLGALDVATVLNPDLEIGTTTPPPSRVSPRTRALELVVRRGSAAQTLVRLRNDGLVRDTLSLRGCVAPHLTMTWRAGHREVGGRVRAGTYRTPGLAPDSTQRLRWRVTAGRHAHGTLTCALVARSTHDAKAVDRRLVKIVVKRAR